LELSPPAALLYAMSVFEKYALESGDAKAAAKRRASIIAMWGGAAASAAGCPET